MVNLTAEQSMTAFVILTYYVTTFYQTVNGGYHSINTVKQTQDRCSCRQDLYLTRSATTKTLADSI